MATETKNELGAVLLAGLVFGVALGAVLWVTTASGYYAFHGGFLGGALFALALKAFLRIETPRAPVDAGKEGFDEGETLLHHGPANHYKGIEAVGGRLFLTDKRLRFRSHAFNVQKHDESYPIDAIASVEPARTLGVVPNGLLVSLRDGRKERFVVSDRAGWVARLRGAASG